MKVRDDTLKILVNNLSLRDYAYVTKDISNLEIEIERLKKSEKEALDTLESATYENIDLPNEVDRLNNIINELEKWLVEWRKMLDCPDFYEEGIIDCINDTLTKLQELKGDGSNEKDTNE